VKKALGGSAVPSPDSREPGARSQKNRRGRTEDGREVEGGREEASKSERRQKGKAGQPQHQDRRQAAYTPRSRRGRETREKTEKKPKHQ
jgi:hypothetical protein